MGKILVAYFSASGTTAKRTWHQRSMQTYMKFNPKSCIQERIWIGRTERAGAVWK